MAAVQLQTQINFGRGINMNYSRRQLEAFGEPLGECVTRKEGGRIIYGGGGGGGPTQTTVNQSNIPDWLRPQVETVLGGAMQELFTTQPGADGAINITGTKPYVPYSTDPSKYVAPFQPMQVQAQRETANLQVPEQYMAGSQMAGTAGIGALGSTQQAGYYGGMGAGYGGAAAGMAPQAQAYGRAGSDIGLMGLRAEGLGRGITQQARGYAQNAANVGGMYGQMATSPGAYQAYMSPYQQAVTDVQMEGARRQSDITRQQRQAQFAKAGAYGGARQAIEEAEAQRALGSQLQNIQATGLQNAYQQAQQNIAQRAQLELQGLSGAQQGLGTALQGGQLGLSGIGQAMAGQQAGLAGLGQAGQLYGLGMQGAGMGLQGVGATQAGYGLAGQMAGALGNLGQQQLAAQTGILGLQQQVGAQQQAQEQSIINQAIQNYAQGREAPLQSLQQFNALLRGYALPGTTTTQYQAAQPISSQIAGLGTAGIGGLALYNALSPKGGAST